MEDLEKLVKELQDKITNLEKENLKLSEELSLLKEKFFTRRG